MRCEAI